MNETIKHIFEHHTAFSQLSQVLKDEIYSAMCSAWRAGHDAADVPAPFPFPVPSGDLSEDEFRAFLVELDQHAAMKAMQGEAVMA